MLLGQTLLGAALYWWAGPLSHSMPFRLSAGSLGFMALSVLILIFVLSRSDAFPCLCSQLPLSQYPGRAERLSFCCDWMKCAVENFLA